jgi:hypothetical protein
MQKYIVNIYQGGHEPTKTYLDNRLFADVPTSISTSSQVLPGPYEVLLQVVVQIQLREREGPTPFVSESSVNSMATYGHHMPQSTEQWCDSHLLICGTFAANMLCGGVYFRGALAAHVF